MRRRRRCGRAAGAAPREPIVFTGGSGTEPRGGPGSVGGRGSEPTTDPLPLEPGSDVDPSVSPDVLDPIVVQLERARSLDAAGLATERAVPFQSTLGYAPLEALGLAPIQAHWGLTEARPRAYAGIGLSFREHIEPGLTRLTDEQWTQRMSGVSSIEPWLAPLMPAP